MADISDSVENTISESMPRALHVSDGDSTLYLLEYMNRHFVRYIKGQKQLTCDCRVESLPSWSIDWLPRLIRTFVGPKRYVVELKSPIVWDNGLQAIPKDEIRHITFQIKRAAQKKYAECHVELDRQTLQV